MKKLLFSFILILICISGGYAMAEDNIFSYSFTKESDASSWPGAFYDRSIAHEDGYCAFIKNPFGEVKNNTVTHVIDYTGKIHLEAGNIYTLSGYVMNPLTDYSTTIKTSAKLENSANTVIVTVSGADTEWDRFSTTFYAGETGDFNLAIHFTGGNTDFGFFVDEITLSHTPYVLASLAIEGPSEILIPSKEKTRVSFSPYLIATDSTKINILSSGSVVSSCSNAHGISFDQHNFILEVTPDAISSTVLTVDFALKNYAQLSPHSIFVTLTDNMISATSLSESNLLWKSTSPIEHVEESGEIYVSLQTNDYGNFGYFSNITYDVPQLLIEDELYVIRAKVKSDTPVVSSSIFAKNIAYTNDNTVYFNINDISGTEWTEVFAAFSPSASGIYTVSANLCSTYDCTVYIKDIRLCTEFPRAEYITLHAPGNIAIPDVKTTYPVSALLRDQLGNIIDTDNIAITLATPNDTISFDSDNNLLTVYPDTLSGEYTLSAFLPENPTIKTELSFNVGSDYIGDGKFEEKIPNEWWMATSPYACNFYIRNDGYSKRALVSCAGEFFILLNNSYVHLLESFPYVFNGNFSSTTDCTVTLFIEAIDSSLHPLAQFHIPSGITLDDVISPELFLSEVNIVGRPFLYVQSDNSEPFTFYADNLSLKKASIVAGNLHIDGNIQINSAAEADFALYNSIAQNNDISACVINWYISSDPSSGFVMLNAYEKTIYFDTTFLNKYIYFEVIPVCPITGFSGDPVRSPVFKVAYEGDSQNKAFIVPTLSLTKVTSPFTDTVSHWGKDYIDILFYSGIIHGKTADTFKPDDYITRAEFAKLISTAFSPSAPTDFSVFSDVKKSDWFYEHVTALSTAGIVNGTSFEKFSPHKNITRQDATVILMRVYSEFFESSPSNQLTYKDADSISPYARTSVNSADALGIITGTPSGKFKPSSPITRAEAAAMLYRTVKAVKSQMG